MIIPDTFGYNIESITTLNFRPKDPYVQYTTFFLFNIHFLPEITGTGRFYGQEMGLSESNDIAPPNNNVSTKGV